MTTTDTSPTRVDLSSLPAALDAPRLSTTVAGKHIAYYAATSTSGIPLVLLHSINAAPSAIEVKPLFDHYREQRPVIAPDLPGFGASARPDHDYTPDEYAEAICGLITSAFDVAVDVVALSLTSEFAARAISLDPARFRSLTMISPTGFGARQPPGPDAARRIRRVLKTPLLGAGLYRSLTSRVSIRYFLNKAFEGGTPDSLVEYAWRTARQPGARFAPFSFLSMGLFTRSAVDTLYKPLRIPVLVVFDQDPNVSFDRLDEIVESHSNWRKARVAPTRGLPHFEQPDQVFKVLDSFWRNIEESPIVR